MAVDIAQPMRFTVDLDAGLVQIPLRTMLRKGDRQANKIIATVMRGKKEADLAGVSASGIFHQPPNGDNIPLEGDVSENTVTVMLHDACYANEGRYTADVKITAGGTTRTILTITGDVTSDGSDVYIDVSGVIPSISELLAQLAALKDTTARANAAADRVEQMQIDASGLAGDSNKLGGKPPEAYSAVNLLDNSNFRNPVNQRNRSGVNLTAGYMLDRWRTWTDGGTVYFNVGKYMGIEVLNLYQYLPEPYDRGVLTAAVKVYGVDEPFVCTIDTSIVGSASNTWVWITREERALSVGLVKNQVYEWAALYEGEYTADTLPPYRPKPYSVELAECQRRFHVYETESARPSKPLDCCPPMELAPGTTEMTQGSMTVDGKMLYYNSTDL